jgi:hypothetical protein
VVLKHDPLDSERRAEQREALIIELRREALGLCEQITSYCEHDIPFEATWPDIEFQVHLNRQLRHLRDEMLRLGEHAPPAGR